VTGLLVRPPTPADAQAVAELVHRYDTAHGVEDAPDADEIGRDWAELDLGRDAWLLELDGRLAGSAAVFGRGGELLQGDGYVDPALRGRGIGSRILELTEARARERGVARLHNATLHADEAGRRLLEGRGYRFVRAFLRMAIELDGPPEPAVPAGLRLERMPEGDESLERAVHAAVMEAFEDHWEHEPRPFERWLERRKGSDRSLWWLVRDGDEVAGVAVNDRHRFGAGWIGSLATRRAWRGRGVARALLLASFAEFHRRGERTVALAVDAASPTGAVRLYERVGMRTVWRADVHEKLL
jgi:mycothiol synthase